MLIYHLLLIQTLINQCANSYLSYNDPRLHIGLGNNKKINSLEVKWMDGHVDVFTNIVANHYVTIEEGGMIKTN